MKVAQINGGVSGSTGKIMGGIKKLIEAHGHKALCMAPVISPELSKQSGYSYERIGNSFSRKLSVLFCRLTGLHEFAAPFATLRMIGRLKKFDPDLIQLHNLHGDFINLPMLFKYIKKHHIKTVWTLHDCWAFTGHCPHFELQGCEKWREGCYACPSYTHYPKTYLDDARRMYRKKKKWFCGVEDMTLVTPSRWLAGLVKESFLGGYEVRVIPNGIDLSAFTPTESDFRHKYGLGNRTIILGVSFVWDKRKGIDVFPLLRDELNDRYAIVLVGTNDQIDESLPKGILSIHRTVDRHALAEIYTAADMVVNPTREDNYPTVNLEAVACGTPVITFNTGGSPESLDESCGSVVEKDDIDGLVAAIKARGRKSKDIVQGCIEKAKAFDEAKNYQFYEEIYTGGTDRR